jgi:hypothetical protein
MPSNLLIVSQLFFFTQTVQNKKTKYCKQLFHVLVGLYQWNDNSLGTFDSRHIWWCKTGIPDLGYYHPYQDPTRLIYNNDEEKCVLFRRGKSSVQMLCLDDVFCNEEYPFVCERCM